MNIIKGIVREEWESSDSGEFRTKQTGTDPQTGQVSWDVAYTPVKSLNKNLDKVQKDFKEITKQDPEDARLEKLYEDFLLLKKRLRMHLSRKTKR